jgi:alkyldihydroxyacetonephosphate synthase
MKLTVDQKSLLVNVDGRTTLGELEASLAPLGLTLDVALDIAGAKAAEESVASWLAAGARGAREAWLDPADHLVAGCEVRLHDGSRLEVRPAPRRAVGPDLIALVVGMNERFAKVERACLRVHPVGVKRPNLGSLAVEPNPEVSPEEARLLDAMASRLARPTKRGA